MFKGGGVLVLVIGSLSPQGFLLHVFFFLVCNLGESKYLGFVFLFLLCYRSICIYVVLVRRKRMNGGLLCLNIVK